MNAVAKMMAAPGGGATTVLGPVDEAFLAGVEVIDAWIAGAAAGERCVYARTAVLPMGSKGGMRARGLYDLGLVSLERSRWRAVPDLFEYRMKRIASEAPAAEPVAPTVRLSPEEQRVLTYCEERAEASAPMETNVAMAWKLGLRSGTVVNRCLTRLIEIGLIRRTPLTARPFRIITIATSGLRTAGRA